MTALYFKQYPFSLLIACAICILSLCPASQIELPDISLIDKWAHFCMYGGLSGTVWTEYAKSHRPAKFRKAILPAVVLPLALGGTMELMQAYCTATRSGDWLDMGANAIGVVLGTAVGYFVVCPFIERRKR